MSAQAGGLRMNQRARRFSPGMPLDKPGGE